MADTMVGRIGGYRLAMAMSTALIIPVRLCVRVEQALLAYLYVDSTDPV
jgi:hypothetical protein